jgi:hypothetical protein
MTVLFIFGVARNRGLDVLSLSLRGDITELGAGAPVLLRYFITACLRVWHQNLRRRGSFDSWNDPASFLAHLDG